MPRNGPKEQTIGRFFTVLHDVSICINGIKLTHHIDYGDLRKAAKDEAAAAKADEAARKRREKAELLAAEEADTNAKPKKAPGGAKKGGKKKKNDLSLLEDALVSAADKKVKKKKEELRQKEQAAQEAAKKKNEEEKVADPLLAATEQMLGGDGEAGRQANLERMNAEDVSGLDAALGQLGVSAPGEAKSAKALYAEFEAKMLPVVKEDLPGLRLTQYKEKVWNLWKKAPENPANQVPPSS